jgi:DNA phosphorothioation-associated putative methyltransferase
MDAAPPLDLDAFLLLTTALRTGKKLPDAIYLHKEAVHLLPGPLQQMVAWASDVAGRPPYNLVKLGRARNGRISLLSYPAFYTDPFPSLAEAWTIDLATRRVRHREWAQDGTQPILHRKEEMLPSTASGYADLVVPRWRALTRELERRGVYGDTARIGMARVWAARLQDHGIVIHSHRIVPA